MKPIGKRLSAVLLVIVALGANIALGAVTASLDRNQVTLGDTVRLTITATDDEEISDTVLQALQKDFDIVQRATSSNTSIINGSISQSRQMNVDLVPRREGNLQIPPMQFGQSTTPGITVVVGPASDTPGDGQRVVFEADVDQDDVYVQGQLILTLRVQQAVNLEGRSITPLKLDNAFVKPLEQHSFQRVIDGRQWLVDEVRYAIFPETSGTLEIPAQVFSGRLDQGHRSFFDIGGGGQLVRRSTQAIHINVLPKPASYPADDWLPAQQLTLQETWSTPPEELQVGESATRTIRIVGEGLQGAQLPPILFKPAEGLKYYPDQPNISEQEIASGLEGIREDSAALVPTRAGNYVIPEIRIPWWDTKSEKLQYAVLPERKITAKGAQPNATTTTGDVPAANTNPTAAPIPSTGIDLAPDTNLDLASTAQTAISTWQILTAVSTLGWVLTLLYVWRKRSPAASLQPAEADNISEKQAFKQLLAVCKASNAAGARSAVIAWVAAYLPGTAAVSLDQVAQTLGDEEFKQQLLQLDAALYRPGKVSWSGDALAACARRVRTESMKARTSNGGQKLQLYPSAQ